MDCFIFIAVTAFISCGIQLSQIIRNEVEIDFLAIPIFSEHSN